MSCRCNDLHLARTGGSPLPIGEDVAMKTRIAVLLGGRSPEHDVSVVTGLQALQALDQTRFDPFVVYVTPQGDWLVGPGLDERRNYLPDEQIRAKLSEVTLDIAAGGR